MCLSSDCCEHISQVAELFCFVLFCFASPAPAPTVAPSGRALLGFCNITVRKRDPTKCANDHPVGELRFMQLHIFFVL